MIEVAIRYNFKYEFDVVSQIPQWIELVCREAGITRIDCLLKPHEKTRFKKPEMLVTIKMRKKNKEIE